MTVWSHVGITCKDPIAIEKFYTRYFGFKRARVLSLGEGKQIVFIKSGNVYLELFAADEDSPNPLPENDGYPYPGWRHIAFAVDDVDAKIAELGDEANINLGPLDFGDFIPGWKGAWVTDPEGNVIEISQGYVDQEDPPTLE